VNRVAVTLPYNPIQLRSIKVTEYMFKTAVDLARVCISCIAMYHNCEPHTRTQVGPGCELVYADNITIVANIIDDMEIVHHKFQESI